MQLKDYFLQTEKQYHLRLKTVVPIDDAAMDRIEFAVAKYLPLKISRPKKTILLRQPMEFPDQRNAEVYLLDMTFGLPVTPELAREDIRSALNVAESLVVVRSHDEPGEAEIERLNAAADIEAEAARRGLVPAALLDDGGYTEANVTDEANLFGDVYNASLLSYLGTVRQERRERLDKVVNAPFKWLRSKVQTPDIVDDNQAFNDSIKDAPPVRVFGQLDPVKPRELRRMFVDADGNRVMLSRPLEGAPQ